MFQGGAYILNILDYFGGGHALMGTVMLEAIAFGWGYGNVIFTLCLLSQWSANFLT